MAIPVTRRVLARAAAMLGGVEALAARLGMSQRLLAHYIEGSDPIPDALLLSAIDVVLDEAPKGASPDTLGGHPLPDAKPD